MRPSQRGPWDVRRQRTRTLYLRSEVLSYSRARGVFAGISLEGSTLRPDNEANRHLYGRSVTAAQIIQESEVQAPAVANDLIAQLQKTSPRLKSS